MRISVGITGRRVPLPPRLVVRRLVVRGWATRIVRRLGVGAWAAVPGAAWWSPIVPRTPAGRRRASRGVPTRGVPTRG
ncbi:MAG: hypothetical protein ACRDUA_01440, partial [Micromonosporaceae bacterium]